MREELKIWELRWLTAMWNDWPQSAEHCRYQMNAIREAIIDPPPPGGFKL